VSNPERDRLVRHLVALGARPDLLRWAEGLDPAPQLVDLPSRVTRGDWKAWLIERSDIVPHGTLVAALANVVRASLLYVPRGEERPLHAVQAAEAYALRRLSEAALRDAAQASADVSVSTCAPEWAARMLALYALDGPDGPASLVDAQGVVRLAATVVCTMRRTRADRLPGMAPMRAYECALERAGAALEPACKAEFEQRGFPCWRNVVGRALVDESRRVRSATLARSRASRERLAS
jgi:hypothetical protein